MSTHKVKVLYFIVVLGFVPLWARERSDKVRIDFFHKNRGLGIKGT